MADREGARQPDRFRYRYREIKRFDSFLNFNFMFSGKVVDDF